MSGAGLGGAPTITRAYGIGAGTVARVGQTITYTVTAAVAIPAGIPIYIEFGGLTNSSTAGSYTTTITTQTAVPATIDTGTTPAVTLAANNTAVTVTLAKSLTFTVDTTAFELDMDPSLPRARRPVGDGRADGADERQLGLHPRGRRQRHRPAEQRHRQPGDPEGVDRQGDLGRVAGRAGVGLHRDRHGRHDRRGVHRLEVRRLHVRRRDDRDARQLRPARLPDTISIANRVAINYASTSGVYSDTVTYTVTPNYN